MLSQEPILCFLYAEDRRPVLVFEAADRATAFLQSFERNGGSAERYYNPTHVYLKKPHGLEVVRAGPHGELAFDFHSEAEAQHWQTQLGAYATLIHDTIDVKNMKRTVLLGRSKTS